MQIAMSKTREKYPLSQKKIIKKTVADALIWCVILAIVSFIIAPLIGIGLTIYSHDNHLSSVQHSIVKSSIFMISAGAIFGSILLVIVSVYLYQRWYFATYFYDLTDNYIVIRKSPLTPREITIPYERIQDVYVDQDIFDRIFGLYDVHLSSATVSSGMEAHIDGVEKVAADGLREALLQIVQERISKKKG